MFCIDLHIICRLFLLLLDGVVSFCCMKFLISSIDLFNISLFPLNVFCVVDGVVVELFVVLLPIVLNINSLNALFAIF